jgi:hypothetical protein
LTYLFFTLQRYTKDFKSSFAFFFALDVLGSTE